ncbi:hypothetical protein Vretimale_4917 [Volvox reticuliferus]|uniref:Uncharacterized protein n=1 Tax=Volvox reticuliferus TaxID=1737510 RepID=A0A8J4DD66_9CHLO|nr:hypothetical protein Vretifemale_4176 [Volvox reticuliferus]GIL99876.1 hypothetical protein Vretimale_4917 [Volvox reticuliferus]
MKAAMTRFKPALIPGVSLEFTRLDQALDALCMSHIELLKTLQVSPAWPYPAALDGWKLGHDAIRYDMDAIMDALETCKSTVVTRNKPLPEWQVQLLKSLMRSFYYHVHRQLRHKRRVLFPWLATRVNLPAKMMDYDEPTLLALTDRVRDLCENLNPGGSASVKMAVRELHAAFLVLRTLLRQQMEREEVLGLPLMRKFFTAREAAVVEKKRISQMKFAELAWLLRPLADAERRATFTRLGIPGLVQTLVLLPALRRADREVLRAHRELASGERLRQKQ